MKRSIRRSTVAVAAVALFGAATCGSSPPPAPSTSATAEPTADLVGPGRAQQVPSGPGSVAGMAADPVAVAAIINPLLTSLVSAVSEKLDPKVNLVDSLNGNEFTGFAPVDGAATSTQDR